MKDIHATILFCCSLTFSIIAIFSPLSTIPASLFLVASVGVLFLNSKKNDARDALEQRIATLEKQMAFMNKGGMR
jgi:hypothetical protein